ncbi:acetyltransferase and amidohydrolase, putative [Geotalea daltonii FRC-32]|uniref:Acetyltransferase and amidohydrolase, putative n=2 Tax=Geotalea TaxID=2910589 RepID=B9M8S6_GEODF|nr:isochorismatase family protein [Geotalea daltonii]ACM20422.1 acetyltransferase and amidohydrolase, putative [Geotalea daltonii FRC-32]
MAELRALGESDLTQIKNWPPYPGDMAQMDYALREEGWLDECLTKGEAFAYAVEEGDQLIGFTILRKTGAAEAEFRIALRADKTGLGFGGNITLQTLRIGFEKHGFSRIHLIVRKNNSRGIKLYQRIGFVDRGECRQEILGNPVDFRLMDISSEEIAQMGVGNPEQLDEKEKPVAKAPGRALIVIDVQNDYMGGKVPIEFPPVEQSLANIGRAMDAAKTAGVPVVVVQNVLPEGAPFLARGTDGAELHATVRSRGWDHYVLKGLPSALAGTGLEEWLRAHGIDTITIVGYMTHNCDLSTVVEGVHAGFAMEVLSDATGAVPYENRAGAAGAAEIHRVMMVVMQARFAAVMGTDEWISILATGAEPERDTIYSSNRRARRLRAT